MSSFVSSRRSLLWLALASVGCGAPPNSGLGVATPVAHLVAPESHEPNPTQNMVSLVRDTTEGWRLRSDFPDGRVTVVRAGDHCVGDALAGLVRDCSLEGEPLLAIAGEVSATVALPEAHGPPPIDVDGSLAGRLSDIRFSIESEGGDGICPGRPTTVRFEVGANPISVPQDFDVVVDAPFPREIGHGVRALVTVPLAGSFVVLSWGRRAQRLVRTDGMVVDELEPSGGGECDCCG